MSHASADLADANEPQLPARRSEQALIDFLERSDPTTRHEGATVHIFCTSLGRGQLASELAATHPQAVVTCNFADLHAARQAAAALSNLPRVTVTCDPDPPVGDQSCELVALPLTAHGDAEWTQELLETACRLLKPDGVLLASTDNPDDRWLREQLLRHFDRVAATRTEHDIVYRGVRRSAIGKSKNHICWFAFRDGDSLLRIVSRPGVFSHRRLDTGARSLIEAMTIKPGDRVIEFGCGAGAVSLAAAARAAGVRVLAIDSNPRAVQCTQWGAEANGLACQPSAVTSKATLPDTQSDTQSGDQPDSPTDTPTGARTDDPARRPSVIQVALDADARCDQPGTYDVALANPPYYSKHRIAQLFATGAARALRPAGLAYFVTKNADWYVDNLPHWFDEIEIQSVRDYLVVRGRRASHG